MLGIAMHQTKPHSYKLKIAAFAEGYVTDLKQCKQFKQFETYMNICIRVYVQHLPQ